MSQVLNLAEFRSKKEFQAVANLSSQPTIIGVSPQEISTHIDSIKASIQRINKLMEELRSLSTPTSSNKN